HESDNAILASSIIDVMENCPVAFNVGDRTAVISKIENDIVFLKDGEREVPAFSFKDAFENLLNETISGPFPKDDEDVMIELRPRQATNEVSGAPTPLSTSLVVSVVVLTGLAYFVWRRRDESR
ncbi:MAG: hypothetical protein GOV00_01555, partial [Candidatus Altiarchaeota archaeon]|nr:hypothetical protein [Candidatus Altiarchaeota archaeon]